MPQGKRIHTPGSAGETTGCIDIPTLHTPTPLLYSTIMSKQAGCNVWLKLENMQPTQSFKIRGIGSMCAKAVLDQGAKRFVAVGDTNAALAVAYSGRQLGVPVAVFVPAGIQPSIIRPKIELEGADVVEGGRTVGDAYSAACVYVQNNDGAVLVDSADNPAVVLGNATIISEIGIQLQRKEPAAVITSVGSGGLLAGIVTGLHQCRWQRVPVIAAETHNTNTFQKALLFGSDDPSPTNRGASGRGKPGGTGIASKKQRGSDINTPFISLLPSLNSEACGDSDSKDIVVTGGGKTCARPDTKSVYSVCGGRARASGGDSRQQEPTVATCLSSGSICSRALELSQAHPVVPVSISEAMAVEACRRLLDDHHLLVEAGSAAALSIVGKGIIHQIVPELDHESHVVVVVTGGANISFDRLEAYRQRFPYPAPIIAKSGQEIFLCMSDTALPATTSAAIPLSTPTASVSASPAPNTLDAVSLTPVAASK
ncbi:catabolic L-serine/threonine dehydratase [Coemansia sp. RSA 1813]|nr:catabolic L-serine/threonine dehydratase [Coemansia sp. RSA 1646]KAJ1766831.1 catabolic L-serine/threonine dehydratase [Coemansia sp. RSA 1843]KAJ2090462.1 catabolic L-serine/threonine dehydratase [Coemansia sp. RSA 986]KAJ2215429.1 catabolic L-serine/threonine dehydratase [Coemansia sp. RSA 487]KAJ2570018.1 catabolic L-serine/threonine dehydratase [Coemansia sp. RSA 1813]